MDSSGHYYYQDMIIPKSFSQSQTTLIEVVINTIRYGMGGGSKNLNDKTILYAKIQRVFIISTMNITKPTCIKNDWLLKISTRFFDVPIGILIAPKRLY